MEKNNEKELRIYSRPECEIVKIAGDVVILDGGIEQGSGQNENPWG